MGKKKCAGSDHCYCITGTKGLNGEKCKRGFGECCKCGDKKAPVVTITNPIPWTYPYPSITPYWERYNPPSRGANWCGTTTNSTALDLSHDLNTMPAKIERAARHGAQTSGRSR